MQHAHPTRWIVPASLPLLGTPLLAAADAAPAPVVADAALIRTALSAAPAAIARHAAVVVMEADGRMRRLRKGSNGFTYMPGDPSAPGPTAMCADAASMAWLHAWMERKPPPARVGLAYMLAGGTDASNTDAFAQAPGPDGQWIKTGPHVMALGADKAFYAQYPAGPDPGTSVPYVMWAGTPYEHLMAPTR